MKPAPFTYHAPSSLAEAAALLAEHENARLLAGGQSLVPMMNFRYAAPDHLVDLNGIDALQGIEAGATISLGAMTRQRDIEFSTDLATHCPVLIEALRNVGHRQTRNRGTIGGSLAHADPAADWVAVLPALGGTAIALGPKGERRLPLATFILGIFETALAPDELLRAVELPVLPAAAKWGHWKFCRKVGEFSKATACVLSVPGAKPRAVLAALDGPPLVIEDASALLADPAARRRQGENGARFMAAGAAALAETLAILESALANPLDCR